MKCYDCPRACGVDRESGNMGFCGGGKYARVAKVINEFKYEEPCLGEVAAVFFGGCSLRCSYCQNYKISRSGAGREYDDKSLAELFDGTDKSIDLVTPTHYLSAVERALPLCKKRHSFVYNTSGYETIDGVKRSSEFTDVFLTDFKYADGEIAKRFSSAADYFETALNAIIKMRDKKDEWVEVDGVKLLKRGLIIRHLVLPNHADNSIKVLDAIKEHLGANTIISLMSQFTPNGVGEPNTRLRKIEYKLVVEHAVKLGFDSGYIQEFSSADSSFTPDFD